MFDPDRAPRAKGVNPISAPPDGLARYRVNWNKFDARHIEQLEDVLDGARNERVLQRFLAAHPHLLILGLLGQMRQEAWVLDRPSFADKYIPDFLIGMRDSLGPVWMLVELESPRANPLRKNGEIRQSLHHAVGQIRDWRRWLMRYGSYLREKDGYWGITAECEASVVIGRRKMRDSKDGRNRIREYRTQHIDVMSYDRLVETARQQRDWLMHAMAVPHTLASVAVE